MSDEDVVENGNETSSEPSQSEVKARRLGWLPQEEFKGDPEQWRDADAFLKRGEEIHGFLKADLDRLHGTITQRDREIVEMRQAMEEFRKFHNETEARAYKRAIEELKALKAQAVEEGNGNKVVEIDDQLSQLKEAQHKKETIPEPKTEQVNQEYLDWLPENRWYADDLELQQLADDFGEVIKKRQPNLVGKAFLNEVTKRVKEAAPDKFENPARKNTAVGTNSDSRPAGGKRKKGYNDLPSEAKAACDKMVKQKLLTVDEYLAEYDWE